MFRTSLVLALSTAAVYAQPTHREWSYCMVVAPRGYELVKADTARKQEYVVRAKICYAESNGCRWETVEVKLPAEVLNTGYIGPVGNVGPIEATAKALAKLGADGWEMIGGASPGSIYSDSLQQGVIVLRRLKK